MTPATSRAATMTRPLPVSQLPVGSTTWKAEGRKDSRMSSADQRTGRTEKESTIQVGSWARGKKMPETNWRMRTTGVTRPEAARWVGRVRPITRPRAVQVATMRTMVAASSPQARAVSGRLMSRAQWPTRMSMAALSRARMVLDAHLLATWAHDGAGSTARRLSAPVSRSPATVTARFCRQVVMIPVVIIAGSRYWA